VAILAPAYRPRRPTETVLYGLVREHLASFLAHARESHDGGVPCYVEAELRACLKCGVFSEGFTRCHCDACGHHLLVAFSCKGRSVCPSCCGRRMANVAAHLVDRVLPDVPVRQFVLSLPFELRRLAAFKADVLSALARIFVEAIFAEQRGRAKRAGIEGRSRSCREPAQPTRTAMITIGDRTSSRSPWSGRASTCMRACASRPATTSGERGCVATARGHRCRSSDFGGWQADAWGIG
jgi:hypothetical protein